jgi:hypothetical protein
VAGGGTIKFDIPHRVRAVYGRQMGIAGAEDINVVKLQLRFKRVSSHGYLGSNNCFYLRV